MACSPWAGHPEAELAKGDVLDAASLEATTAAIGDENARQCVLGYQPHRSGPKMIAPIWLLSELPKLVEHLHRRLTMTITSLGILNEKRNTTDLHIVSSLLIYR